MTGLLLVGLTSPPDLALRAASGSLSCSARLMSVDYGPLIFEGFPIGVAAVLVLATKRVPSRFNNQHLEIIKQGPALRLALMAGRPCPDFADSD